MKRTLWLIVVVFALSASIMADTLQDVEVSNFFQAGGSNFNVNSGGQRTNGPFGTFPGQVHVDPGNQTSYWGALEVHVEELQGWWPVVHINNMIDDVHRRGFRHGRGYHHEHRCRYLFPPTGGIELVMATDKGPEYIRTLKQHAVWIGSHNVAIGEDDIGLISKIIHGVVDVFTTNQQLVMLDGLNVALKGATQDGANFALVTVGINSRIRAKARGINPSGAVARGDSYSSGVIGYADAETYRDKRSYNIHVSMYRRRVMTGELLHNIIMRELTRQQMQQRELQEQQQQFQQQELQQMQQRELLKQQQQHRFNVLIAIETESPEVVDLILQEARYLLTNGEKEMAEALIKKAKAIISKQQELVRKGVIR